MINVERLNVSVGQPDNGCVMASYAVANHYHTGANLTDCFDAYFEHHGRPERGVDAGRAFFDAAMTNSHGQPWSKHALDIHTTSRVPFFRRSREAFTGTFYPEEKITPEIEIRLRFEDAVYVLGLTTTGMFHVVTIAAVQGGFALKDTNRVGLVIRPTTAELLTVDPTWKGWRDGVLYTAS